MNTTHQIPFIVVLDTARKLLEEGIISNSKIITFPVTNVGCAFFSNLVLMTETTGEMHTMYTNDGKKWQININDEVYFLGDYPKVYKKF